MGVFPITARNIQEHVAHAVVNKILAEKKYSTMSRNYIYPKTMTNGISSMLNHDHRDGAGEAIDFSYSRTFLNDVGAKLPERKPVPNTRPTWLKDFAVDFVAAGSNLDVRFLADGAGYRNAVGYFVYPTASPPQSVSEIDLVLCFPNASRNRKRDGKLKHGDTFQVPYTFTKATVDGREVVDEVTSWIFPQGYSVGFFIVANGWNGYEVSTTKPIYFSLSHLNPEADAEDKFHTVAVLSDVIQNTLIVGFEDLNRQYGGDNDFNDFVFTVQPTALSFIERDRYNATNFNSFEGTIIANDEQVFSDQFNDCDYNDLVVAYQVKEDLSGDDYVITKITMDFDFTHRGSWHDHEFGVIIPNVGFQLGTATRTTFVGESTTPLVEDITADVFSESNVDGKVTVATSTKTLLPPNPTLENQFCNTWNNWDTPEARVPPSSVRVVLTFNNTVNRATFNNTMAPYIPFLRVHTSGDTSVPGTVYERREDEFLTAPPIFSNGGINQLRPLYILRGEMSYRPLIEKNSVHHGYPRFFAFALSDETDQLMWWDNFFEEEKLTNAVAPIDRSW